MAFEETIIEEKIDYHSGNIPSHIRIAIEYGQIIPDATLEDYLNIAVQKNGYETVGIHGTQGSGKSSFALQVAAWVMLAHLKIKLGRNPTEQELWESVLNCLVFKPADFVRKLEAVTRGERLPIVVWDDIGVHYTSSTFRTDIEQYAAIDATWAAIRTKVGVVVITIPVINRLAKNVKDNLTFEVFIGRNQMKQIRRLFYLPGMKGIDANLFKPQVEEPEQFDLYQVPEWVWKKYWEMRLDLTEQALAALKGATDMEEESNWIPVIDIAMEVGQSEGTIAQGVSRGNYEGKKIKGTACLSISSYVKLKRSLAARGKLPEGIDPESKEISLTAI